MNTFDQDEIELGWGPAVWLWVYNDLLPGLSDRLQEPFISIQASRTGAST